MKAMQLWLRAHRAGLAALAAGCGACVDLLVEEFLPNTISSD